MALDDFEAKHMDPQGRVILRDKQVAGTGMRVMAVIFPAVFLLSTIALAISGAVGAAAGVGVLTALFALSFAMMLSLRTAVTDNELLIRCGFWGPRIPVTKIKSCRVAEQKQRIRVGGKRYEDGMWTTDYLMRTGEYVEVVWTNESGSDRRLRFTPENPQSVVQAIQQARSSLATGMRIADSSADIVYPEEEVEEREASSQARSEK